MCLTPIWIVFKGTTEGPPPAVQTMLWETVNQEEADLEVIFQAVDELRDSIKNLFTIYCDFYKLWIKVNIIEKI